MTDLLSNHYCNAGCPAGINRRQIAWHTVNIQVHKLRGINEDLQVFNVFDHLPDSRSYAESIPLIFITP